MGYGTEVTVKAAVGRPIVKLRCGKLMLIVYWKNLMDIKSSDLGYWNRGDVCSGMWLKTSHMVHSGNQSPPFDLKGNRDRLLEWGCGSYGIDKGGW